MIFLLLEAVASKLKLLKSISSIEKLNQLCFFIPLRLNYNDNFHTFLFVDNAHTISIY